jgi:two-component system NarL family response regulator
MKVLLVDDNRLMLEGLQNLLEAHNIEVAGTAANGFEAIKQVRKISPDVILMDIRMPECDGLCATRLIKADVPDSKIIILTTSTEDDDLFEAIKAGACGYLLKTVSAEELVEALEQVEQGIPPFSPGLAARLLAEFGRLRGGVSGVASAGKREASQKPPGSELNPRQTEVLNLVAQGLSYKEVGARLNLSPRTIKYHMSEIMFRLHLDNRAQVLAYAGRMRSEEKPPGK